eukprot:2616654-Amphidinium_carterae.1
MVRRMGWVRLLRYDADTEAMLRRAERHLSRVPLETLLVLEHPVFRILADVADAYQSFLIDSGTIPTKVQHSPF